MNLPERDFTGTFSDTEAASAYLRIVNEVNGYKKSLIEALQPKPGEIIVDIGCGTGLTGVKMTEIPDIRIIGVDKSREFLHQTKETLIYPVQGDGMNLPFKNNFVDAAFAERSLQWMERPKNAVEEAKRILRPEGRFVTAEVDWQNVTIDHPDTELTNQINNPENIGLPSPRLSSLLPELLDESGLRDTQVLTITDNLPSFIAIQVLPFQNMAENAVLQRIINTNEKEGWLKGFEDKSNPFPVQVPVVITHSIK